MINEKIIMFQNRLQKVYRHIGKQAKRLNISCYRVYDHDLPEFPFCIEIYEDKLYVAEYKRQYRMTDEEHNQWIKKSMEVIKEVFQVQEQNIFLKLRKKKEGRKAQYQKTGENKNEFIVHENELQFIVNLSDYLYTCLFFEYSTII